MIGSPVIAWVIAGAACVAAFGFFLRLRQLAVEAGEARIAADKLGGELRASREQLERESGKLRRKSDELAELRKRHDKLKKRKDGHDGGGAKPSSGAASVTEREVEEARQARDRARAEVQTLDGELEAVRDALAAATAAPPPPPPDSISGDEAAKLRAEAAKAGDTVQAARKQADDADKMVVRLKKRLDAQELAYVQMRGELEAKKDRLSTQQEQIERLRALKVSLVDEPAGEAPAEADAPTHAEAEDEALAERQALAEYEASDETPADPAAEEPKDA